MIKSQERSYINAAFVVSLIFIGTLLQLVQDNEPWVLAPLNKYIELRKIGYKYFLNTFLVDIYIL